MPRRVAIMRRLVSLSSAIRMQGGLIMPSLKISIGDPTLNAPLERRGGSPKVSLIEMLSYFRQQLAWTVRLRDIGVATGVASFALVAAQRIGGDHDDRNMLQIRLRFDAPRRFVTVENRQLNIHQNKIRLLHLDDGQRL